MSEKQKRIIRCVVACVDSEGSAALFPVRVQVTEDQYEEGHHYGTSAQAAEEAGYAATNCVFDELDGEISAKVIGLYDWVDDKEIETVVCVEDVIWEEESSPTSQFHDLPSA
jgi:hypothetical protein